MSATAARALSLTALLAVAVAAPAVAQVPESDRQPRVVVAVVDSAPNPFHEFFRAGSSLYATSAPTAVTPDVLAEFGIDDSHIIDVETTGDFTADFARVKPQFDAIRRGEPYWFKGTNIIGVSFSANDKQRLRPDGSSSTHGIGVGAAVLAANPEAVLVMVEAPGAPLAVPGFATQPLGEQWAFNHPAVDIVSTSYGPPGSPPLGYHLEDAYTGVVKNGKFHTGASDNSPALSPIDATSGPWFSIGVAGYGEGSSNERTLTSGSLPDFVADFTQTLPYCRSCETGTRQVSGTSFATPRTAGTLSRIVLEARRAAGHLGGIVAEGAQRPLMVRGNGFELTNWKIRRALEEAAYYPATGEWEPGTSGPPVVDAAPWATTGWGAVTPDPARRVVPEALAQLGIGGPPTRSKGAAPCASMTANIRARHLWWDRVAPFSESSGAAEDPFAYC